MAGATAKKRYGGTTPGDYPDPDDTMPPADLDNPKATLDHMSAWRSIFDAHAAEESASAKTPAEHMKALDRARAKTDTDMKARAKKLRMQDTGGPGA